MVYPEVHDKPKKRARFGDVEVIENEQWVSHSNDVLTFRMVETPEEWEKAQTRQQEGFKPDFTHQVFSDEEEIKGYKDLSIDVFINARDFTTLVKVNYNEKSNKADDVDSMLAETFEAGILQGPDADARFHESLESAGDMTAKDYGEEMERHTLEAGAELIITRVNLASASEELRALHSRMQPLLLFFVDGASGIDSQDPAWDLLVALRESKGSLQVMGFCTVFRHFAFPDSHRLKLSQIIVLKPHQRQGVASRLLSAVTHMAIASGAKDVTQEDPTPVLQRLRERLDVEACKLAPWLQEAAAECVVKASECEGPAEAEKCLQPPPVIVRRVQDELKISSSWFKRVWEVVLMQHVQKHGESAMPPLIGYIKTRMGGGEGELRDSKGKRTWDTETGFVMARTAASIGVAPVLEEPEMTEEQRAEVVAEAVGERLNEIQELLER